MKDRRRYLFHILRDAEANVVPGLALARVCDAEQKLDVAFIDPYPAEKQDGAVEWLSMHLEGFAACLEYEWWDVVEDEAVEAYENLMGRPWPPFRSYIDEFWRERDAKEVSQ